MTFETALRSSELILAFSIVQQALEHLAGGPRDRWWFFVQLALAVGMAAAPWNGIMHLLLLGASGAILNRFKGPYNGGSDRMRLLLLFCLCAARLAPNQRWGEIALGYFAVQLLLSYVLAGWVKLVNPEWRSGQALADVFAFSVYPVSDDLRALASSRQLLVAASWFIILFEVLFPLALFDNTMLQAALALALLFHLVNACVFGLNRFLWVWAAGYPCLLWFQREFDWHTLLSLVLFR